MNDSKISVRYAKAIFSFVKDKSSLAEVYQDFEKIKDVFSNTPELLGVLSSPIVRTEDKLSIINNVFANLICETALQSLIFILSKGREEFLLRIIYDFDILYRNQENIKQVVLSTETIIDASLEEKITKIVEDTYKSKVEIKNIVDPSMIGGIKIRIDNNMLDLSVKTQIEQIKKILNLEK